MVHEEEHLCTSAGCPALGRLHLDLPTALLGAAFCCCWAGACGPTVASDSFLAPLTHTEPDEFSF